MMTEADSILESVLITTELERRSSRAPDYRAENLALTSLAEAMIRSPDTVLQHLVELAMQLTRADSAGISLLEPGRTQDVFRWVATAGAWAPYRDGTMLREESPCGAVVAQEAVLLMHHPERAFPALLQAEPGIHEGLLAPFHMDGKAVGTVWVVKHDPAGAFEPEDSRLLYSLARFAATAHQMVRALAQAKEAERDLTDRVEERTVALRESEERFRQFGENAPDAMWIINAETETLEYLSPAFEQIWGEPRSAVMADLSRWSDLVHPDDREAARAAMPALLKGKRSTIEYRIVRSDGEVRYICDTGFPIVHGSGQVKRVAGIAEDVTERTRLNRELGENRRWLTTLMEGMPQLVWRAVDGGEWTWASPQWSDYTGLSDNDSRGRGWLQALHPEDRDIAMTAWAKAAQREAFEARYRIYHTEEDRFRWFQTRASPVRDEAGHVIEWLGTSTDVDDMHRLQEQQGVMVAELQHRTRNLLGVVRSIASQTLGSAASLDRFRDDFNDRLAALSRVQGLLSRADREPVTIGALIRQELDALGAKAFGDRVVIEGPEVPLRKSTVQTLALALHELAINAHKYGALFVETGRLRVHWQVRDADGQSPRLALDWLEEGICPRDENSPVRKGYGRKLIEKALPYSLDAETSYELGETTVRCTIDMPLGRGRSEAE